METKSRVAKVGAPSLCLTSTRDLTDTFFRFSSRRLEKELGTSALSRRIPNAFLLHSQGEHEAPGATEEGEEEADTSHADEEGDISAAADGAGIATESADGRGGKSGGRGRRGRRKGAGWTTRKVHASTTNAGAVKGNSSAPADGADAGLAGVNTGGVGEGMDVDQQRIGAGVTTAGQTQSQGEVGLTAPAAARTGGDGNAAGTKEEEKLRKMAELLPPPVVRLDLPFSTLGEALEEKTEGVRLVDIRVSSI